jgi:putative membrane protein
MPRKLRATAAVALAVGIGLFIALLLLNDLGRIAAALAAVGWGIVGVAFYRFVTIAMDAAGWRLLLRDGGSRPSFGVFLRLRWIGEAVNSLLPVAQVGGDVVRASLLGRLGPGGAQAGASVVVDFTLALLAQAAYAVLGVAVLVATGGAGDHGAAIVGGVALGGATAGFLYAVQRMGVFGLFGRLLTAVERGGAWAALAGGGAALDDAVRRLYRWRARLAGCAAWHVAAWLARTAETWMILYLVGTPVGWPEALVIESLANAVRSAAFVVPGALGAQEGGIVLLAALFGVAPEAALALALVKRLREFLIGLPGLAAWVLVRRPSAGA